MEPFEWSDEFSVGVEMIDKQHKILIRAINLLAKAVEYKSSRNLMGEIFDTLTDYTRTHFTYEEGLFETTAYPDTQAHKAQHVDMLNQVVELRKRWESGEVEIGPEVLKFLVDWLRNHILGTDKRYSSFVVQDAGR